MWGPVAKPSLSVFVGWGTGVGLVFVVGGASIPEDGSRAEWSAPMFVIGFALITLATA